MASASWIKYGNVYLFQPSGKISPCIKNDIFHNHKNKTATQMLWSAQHPTNIPVLVDYCDISTSWWLFLQVSQIIINYSSSFFSVFPKWIGISSLVTTHLWSTTISSSTSFSVLQTKHFLCQGHSLGHLCTTPCVMLYSPRFRQFSLLPI